MIWLEIAVSHERVQRLVSQLLVLTWSLGPSGQLNSHRQQHYWYKQQRQSRSIIYSIYEACDTRVKNCPPREDRNMLAHTCSNITLSTNPELTHVRTPADVSQKRKKKNPTCLFQSGSSFKKISQHLFRNTHSSNQYPYHIFKHFLLLTDEIGLTSTYKKLVRTVIKCRKDYIGY